LTATKKRDKQLADILQDSHFRMKVLMAHW